LSRLKLTSILICGFGGISGKKGSKRNYWNLARKKTKVSSNLHQNIWGTNKMAHGYPDQENCPACGRQIVRPHAAMSRYVNLFICSACGLREALQGFFWEPRYNLEKPTQPSSYNPWVV